ASAFANARPSPLVPPVTSTFIVPPRQARVPGALHSLAILPAMARARTFFVLSELTRFIITC
ncbi:MAG TPA: hypothetical protein VMC03_07870, partial [Streptosporangiaceae bacterium]|nr:hypothetical protein [Streptosporangiaceae bacterium]